MDRKDRILAMIDRNGRGLEIGPSMNPVAPKREGYDVEILDHADRSGLLEKYSHHGIALEAIEEVDFVWKGGSYLDLTDRAGCYDWIIASHVIEHVPNLIAFVNDCASLLKPDGVLSLAIPDKRFCFDRYRAPTSLRELIDAYMQKRSNHTPGSVADYFMNVVKLGGRISWTADLAAGTTLAEVEFVHGLSDAKSGIDAVASQGAYLDIHAWCFTANLFRLLIEDVHQLDICPLRESAFDPAGEYEFFIALSRSGGGHGLDRLDLLREIEHESTLPYPGPRGSEQFAEV